MVELLARESVRASVGVQLDELRVGSLSPRAVEKRLSFNGIEQLDRALGAGRGVLWLYPHAGPVMLTLAALAHRGYRYNQVAARGLAPPQIGQNDPTNMGSNWFRERVRRVRESDEDRLSVAFLDQSTTVRALHRALARNEVVGIAYDGRLGRRFAQLPYLGRPALLSAGPYKLAIQTNALVVPAFSHEGVCEIGAPIEPGGDWRALALRVFATMEGWLVRHPEQYGMWLLHCRERRAADDHPLFLDYPS